MKLLDKFNLLRIGDWDQTWHISSDPEEHDTRLIARALGISSKEVETFNPNETDLVMGCLLSVTYPYKHRTESYINDKGDTCWLVYRCYCPKCDCMQCSLEIGCITCRCDEDLLADFKQATYREIKAANTYRQTTKRKDHYPVELVAKCIKVTGMDLGEYLDWDLRRFMTVWGCVRTKGDVRPLLME